MIPPPYLIACDSERNPIYAPAKLMNAALKTSGGSSNLAVEGTSGAPVDFSISPPPSFGVQVGVLTLNVETSAEYDVGDHFLSSAVATLANGLMIQVKAQNVESVLLEDGECRRTRDLTRICDRGSIDILQGASGSIFRAHLWIPSLLRLAAEGTYPEPDYVRVRVQDDLRGLEFAEVFLQGVKLT